MPFGENLDIQGIRISGGLLYTGNSLSRISGYGVEPALIDPRLPVHESGNGDGMPYWPSYSEITPASRGAYLRWLATGRSDPNATIGFVFLFLYGLERRALAEKAQMSDTEWDQIRVEVTRLLGIYEHSSFQRYATEFLGILGAAAIDGETLADDPPDVTRSYESANLPLRMGLGWMVKNGRAIPPNWALAWVRSHDAFYERTPATRCREQLQRLFSIRYKQQFGEGAIIKPNKTALKASYKPASASFGGAVDLTIPSIPDVAVLRQPIEKLLVMANQCIDDLDPYSRYLGRNPDSGETPAALALLPPVLIQQGAHPTLQRIGAWIDSLSFLDGLAVTTYAALREIWAGLPRDEIAKRDAVMLSQCLAQLGFGVEPDIRFGAHRVKADEKIVLFCLSADSPTAPSAAYTGSTLVAHLGAVVAHADDRVMPEEEEALMSHAAQNLDLNEPERLRLKAYMKWLLLSPPETSGLKKRIESLPPEPRSALGAFLAHLIGLDGHVAPAEITALQKVYRQLGLDPKDVFADTHSAATDHPISMQAAQAAPGYQIPTPAATEGKPRVNLARVRAMEAESERVSVLLRDIFTAEEESVAPTIVAETNGSTVQVLELDKVHSRFALALLERQSWSRADFDAAAGTHGLMPEGAIDALNEAALNLHGEPLLEGDDPLEMNPQLRSVIQP